jgi:AAHS family 4-hydroxybenzoate transporter-like MFS transporter
LASGIYPTESRATGVGWSMGVGRLGAVTGSAAGAWLFSLTPQTAFVLIALPALGISAAMAVLGRIRSAAAPSFSKVQINHYNH